MLPDLINGCFELFGACMLALNVRQLHIDKKRMGNHWAPIIFFTSWGIWNLYFYPSLDQWWSFAGGCAIVIVNTIYLGQILYYEQLPKCSRWISIRRQTAASSSAD